VKIYDPCMCILMSSKCGHCHKIDCSLLCAGNPRTVIKLWNALERSGVVWNAATQLWLPKRFRVCQAVQDCPLRKHRAAQQYCTCKLHKSTQQCTLTTTAGLWVSAAVWMHSTAQRRMVEAQQQPRHQSCSAAEAAAC
jgi:hypothetical protein